MFSTETGKHDHHLSVFIPPKPNRITRKLYGCGKQFITQAIEHLFVLNQRYFGLAIIHGETAKVCLFNEGGNDILATVNEELASRHNKGGQSQNRHQRNHDIMVNVYNDKVSNAIKEVYLDDNGVPCVKGIVIAGTGEKRFGVVKKLPKILQSLIFHEMTVPSKSTTPSNILEQHTANFIQMHTQRQETEVFNGWLQHIILDDGLAVYGKKQVTKMFADGLLKSIIVHVSIFNKRQEKINSVAKKVGCTVNVLSSRGENGQKLLNDYGGVVGVLWY